MDGIRTGFGTTPEATDSRMTGRSYNFIIIPIFEESCLLLMLGRVVLWEDGWIVVGVAGLGS